MFDLMAQEEFGESEHLLHLARAVAESCLGVAGEDKGEKVKDPFVDSYVPAIVRSAR